MRRLLTNIDALHDGLADAPRRGVHVVVAGDRIAAIGEGAAPAGEFDEVIDLAGCLVLPGLVNIHHHFFQTLTRAIPGVQRGHLLDWLMAMYPLWARMTPDDLAAATEAACAELLLTGATTTSDHCYLVPGARPDFVEAEVAAARGMGIRLHLVRGSITALEADLGDRLTALLGPRAGGLLDEPDTVLAEMRRTFRDHHAPGDGAWLTVGLGPTTTTFDDLGYMRRVADLAAEFGGALHTHFHPRPDERALYAERFGRTPIDVLADTGWLRPGTFFAHSTRMDAHDIAMVARAGAGIAHCPRMVMRLGARITPVHAMRAAGVAVGIGVDGASSNDAGSMIGEMRLALLLHRLMGGGAEVPHESWIDPPELLRMATSIGADIIGRRDLGRLAVGAPADIVAFDMTGVGYAGARTDLLSALLLAGSDNRTALTMVGGRPLVRDGRLVGRDERVIRARVDRATARLIEEVSRLTGLDYHAFPARGQG